MPDTLDPSAAPASQPPTPADHPALDVGPTGRIAEVLSADLFRSLTEQSAELISIVDAEGVFRYVSPSVQRILGWAASELVGRAFTVFVHPDDIAVGLATLHGLLGEPRGSRMLTVRFQHSDGSYRWVEASGTNLLDDPAVQGIVVNSRDVTARVLAEQETRFHARLLDAVKEAVIALSPRGRIKSWNRYAEELFGWSAAEAIGKGVGELLVVDPGPEDEAKLQAAIAGATSYNERLAKRRDGSTFLAGITASPIIAADGRITGAVGVVTDITPQRQLEEQLRQSQKMQAVGQLAGGVAHDFNNLLTVISGRAELLRGAEPGARTWESDLDEIVHAADRAAALTKQLLLFSRKQILNPRVIDVNAIVRGLTPMLRRLIGEDVELVTRLPADTRLIRADASQLEQIVMNLVVNARDAMSSGGVVLVATRNEYVAEPRARGMNRREGDYVVVSVKDTGCGMEHETMSRVFEPFFTTKEPGRGTGLGLSTVYGIAEHSGGFVTVSSVFGAGSVFEVYLPAADGAVVAAARSTSAPVISDSRETILVAEDSDQVRSMAERILEKAGFHVLTARDGKEALDLALTHPGRIDLVLTDVVMPRMSGRELGEALAEQRPDITVVFMSGYTDDEIVRRGVVETASRFIEKPFTASRLLEKLRYHLDASKAAR